MIPARSTLEGIGPDLSSLSYCLSLSKSSSQCVLIFSAILRGKELSSNLWCPPYNIISVQSWKTRCQFSNWPSAPLYFGEKVYPGKYFNEYTVLGNDVCIVDKQVVALYRERVEKLAT